MLRNVENCSQSMQAAEITLSAKQVFLIYYVSLHDEGGENLIY